MDVNNRIEDLMNKSAYLIDIFPKTVPQKKDNRFFDVERYFQHNKTELNHKLTKIILKLYCYYSFTIITEYSIVENPQANEIISLIERIFKEELGYINILLPECDALLSLNNGDLYLTAYNIDGESKELLSSLAISEGLFFYPKPSYGSDNG